MHLLGLVKAGTEAEMRALLDAKLNNTDYSPRVRPISDTGQVMSVRYNYREIMHLSKHIKNIKIFCYICYEWEIENTIFLSF